MIKDFLSVMVGWIIGVAVVLALLATVTAKEDEVWFNCYLSGDMRCGETAVWHGYVNLF